MSDVKITVDFAGKLGAVKPMNAVNNGPVWKKRSDQNITNMPEYKAARIPYARTHDAAFFANYGGEHTVDVNNIFPDFDADPDDPASYDFTLTDEYMETIEEAGTQVFYRLGSKIEHWIKKYNTLPPKDFSKWAVICEHIIRHMNYGWADGHHYDIRWWEIWNEPDGAADNDIPEHKLCWGGTRVQFYEFFTIAEKYLKAKFPDLHIGGPALCWPDRPWSAPFLQYLKAHDCPLDFFSWHTYTTDTNVLVSGAVEARKILDENGFARTLSICNEWNYVRSFEPAIYLPCIKELIGLRGAAFEAAAMCACQDAPLDMLMYYDARPCVLNGLFDMYSKKPLKGYYPVSLWSDLAELKQEVRSETSDKDFYCVSATDGVRSGTLITYFSQDEKAAAKTVEIDLKNRTPGMETVYIIDETRDCAPVFASDGEHLRLTMTPNEVVMIK